MNRINLLFPLVVLLISDLAVGRTHVALLAAPGTTADKVAALLTVTLPADANVDLVDRQQFATVLQEQQLADCFGADAIVARLELGKLIRADVLVALRDDPNPVPHLRVVVFDSHRGLRLLSMPAPLTRDIRADAHSIEPFIIAAIDKSTRRITSIVAVPDFVCDDLTRQFADAGGAYSAVVEQSLLGRKGVVVVEIAEARAIARELAVAGQPRVDRPLPFILLGSYRDTGAGAARTVKLHLALRQGDSNLGEVDASHIDPLAISQVLLNRTDRLIGGVLAKPLGRADPDRDARQLYQRGAEFLSASGFHRGLSLCEASLLLRDNPEAHRAAAAALLSICVEERGRLTSSHPASMSNSSAAVFPADCQSLLERGLVHLEAYMTATRLVYLDPADTAIQKYRVSIAPERFARMLIRVAQAKFDGRVRDDTLQYAAAINWRAIAPPATRYKLAARLAQLAQQPRDVVLIASMFSGEDESNPSPVLKSAIGQLADSDNPFARAAVALIRRNQRLVNPVTTAAAPASQPASAADSVVKLVPLQLGLASVSGCFAAGDNLDVIWGRVGREPATVVCALPSEGPIKPLCKTAPHSLPMFDGQYIWTAGDGSAGPQILIVDPATGSSTTIGPKDALPDEKIFSFAAAPLSPGRVCAAIAIGSPANLRSYIALLSCRQRDGKKVIVLQEEKLTERSPDVDRFDPRVAFSPRSASLLTAGPAMIPMPAAIVGFTGGFGWRLVTFPDANSLLTGAKASVTTDGSLWGSCAFHGSVYQTRAAGPAEIRADLLCSMPGARNPQILNHDAVAGTPVILDHGAWIFFPVGQSLYFAENPRQPFHRLKTELPPRFACFGTDVLCPSNRFGLLLLNGDQLYQFQDAAGDPLHPLRPN